MLMVQWVMTGSLAASFAAEPSFNRAELPSRCQICTKVPKRRIAGDHEAMITGIEGPQRNTDTRRRADLFVTVRTLRWEIIMGGGKRKGKLKSKAAQAKENKQEAIRAINNCLIDQPVSHRFTLSDSPWHAHLCRQQDRDPCTILWFPNQMIPSCILNVPSLGVMQARLVWIHLQYVARAWPLQTVFKQDFTPM